MKARVVSETYTVELKGTLDDMFHIQEALRNQQYAYDNEGKEYLSNVFSDLADEFQKVLYSVTEGDD